MPVIAVDIKGNSDIVDHLKDGSQAQPFNYEDLATGIKWCLDNNADRQRSKLARERIKNLFNPGVVSGKYLGLYKDLVKVLHIIFENIEYFWMGLKT